MILFHADDYGMTRAQAKRIISCRLHIKYLKQNPVFP